METIAAWRSQRDSPNATRLTNAQSAIQSPANANTVSKAVTIDVERSRGLSVAVHTSKTVTAALAAKPAPRILCSVARGSQVVPAPSNRSGGITSVAVRTRN